ncbi:MAG TPA: stage II sporulation protein M, partial [Candidatus Methylomirabilis sp.]
MDVTRFVQERRPDWERLDRLLRVAAGGLGRLGKVDLRELGALYRQASSDLARAQAAAAAPELVEYLTALVVRGHGIIYRPERTGWAGLAAFFGREFPQLVRQEWRPILLGVVAFVLPVLWCYAMAALDPQFIEAVAPPGLRERLEKGELWVYRINPIRPLESSRIMTNNIAVSFTYFALGITFGAGTLLGLVSFGVHFGSLSVIVGQTRMAREFWAFVAPHGALEIPAVFFAAAAGFMLGGALLFPGDLRR